MISANLGLIWEMSVKGKAQRVPGAGWALERVAALKARTWFRNKGTDRER
jgi:hypothetical protein